MNDAQRSQVDAILEAEERARRDDPRLLVNILSDAPQKPRLTMAEARGRVARIAVTMLSGAAAAFVDPSLGPVDAATMKAAYEELVARIGVRR